MKTAHLVVGLALIISSGVIGFSLVFQMGISCAEAPQSALCGSGGPLILASGVGGLIFFLILGVMVLWTGTQKRPQQVAQVPTLQATEAAKQATRGLMEGGDLTPRRFVFGRGDAIAALILSVMSLMAWLVLRVYLGNLTNALATEIERGLAANPTEIVRLGGLIQSAALFADVAFLFAFLLLVMAVGFLAYMWGEAPPDPEKLARDKPEEAEGELEAAVEAAREVAQEASVEARRLRRVLEREVREKEEQP